MPNLAEKLEIDGFSIENISLVEINKVDDWLKTNGIIDLSISEKGMVLTLHALNACQEQIVKIDRIIGFKETNKNKVWGYAALEKSKLAGHKTAKDKEWFSLADDDYIKASNELTLAKAAKRWMENKVDYFTNWHYAFKTFLKRDYSLEKIGHIDVKDELFSPDGRRSGDVDLCGEIEWK